MTASTSPATIYNRVAKILHWLLAIAIIGMIIFGWLLDDVPRGPTKFTLMQLHKSIGITILLLSLVRLGWRLSHNAPPLPAGMARWEIAVAHITHVALYVFMIGVPLAGWAMVSTSPLNIPTMLYGVLPWPNLPILSDMASRELSHSFGEAHELMAYTTAALVVLHIGAALKHHFISRDDILLRMAPNALRNILNKIRGEK